MSQKVDYLDEDPIINGQLFALISFLQSKDEKSISAVKIRGIYPSADCDAIKQKVEELKKADKYFDICVAPVGKWCPTNYKDKAYEQDYGNDHLNALMKEYKTNKDKSNLLFEQRKTEMKSGRYENKRQKKVLEKLQRKKNQALQKQMPEGSTIVTEEAMLKEQSTAKEVKTLDQLKKEAQTREKELAEQQKDLVSKRTEINKKEVLSASMEDRLKRANEMYKKISEPKE